MRNDLVVGMYTDISISMNKLTMSNKLEIFTSQILAVLLVQRNIHSQILPSIEYYSLKSKENHKCQKVNVGKIVVYSYNEITEVVEFICVFMCIDINKSQNFNSEGKIILFCNLTSLYQCNFMQIFTHCLLRKINIHRGGNSMFKIQNAVPFLTRKEEKEQLSSLV